MEDMYIPRAQSFRKEFPSSHYAELACSKRVNLFVLEEDEDLFSVPAVPATNQASYQYHYYGERKKGSKGEEKRYHSKKQKQGGRRGSYVSTSRPPKAVDEDLYKIPPEFLYQIPKRKRMLGNFWTGCLGLSCIA